MYQFLATILPSLIILYFFVTQDRFPEPKKNIIITFILGIFITLPAGFLNTFFIYYLYDNFKWIRPYFLSIQPKIFFKLNKIDVEIIYVFNLYWIYNLG